MVNEKSGTGNWKIERGQAQLELAFVVPGAAAAQVDNFNRKLGSFFAGACFVERQEKAAVGRLARPDGFARERRAPERGAGWQSDLEEIALVVSNGVARLDKRFPAANQHLVATFGDVGQENCLRRVARHLQAERARQIRIAGAKTKCRERWRLATRNHFPKVRSIGAIKAFGFEVLDFSCAQDFHGDAAGFALDVEKAKERNIDLSFARTARFSSHDESRILLDGF